MTIDEAITEARKGAKITHRYFSSNEWMKIHGNIVEFEDGVEMELEDFKADRKDQAWQTDWEVFID